LGALKTAGGCGRSSFLVIPLKKKREEKTQKSGGFEEGVDGSDLVPEDSVPGKRRWISSFVSGQCFGLPTTAQRCLSETGTFILEDLFSSVLSQFKEKHPSGNLKFNNFGHFPKFKIA